VTITGLLFDIGDTLLPATRLQRQVLAETAAKMHGEGLLADAALFVQAYERVDAQPEFDDLPDLNHLYGDRRVLERACDVAGRQCDAAFASRFLDAYRTRLRRAIEPSTTLTDTLRTLHRSGLNLGIASNGTAVEQREQLDLLGLGGMFHPVVISQEVGMRKPDPRMLWMASHAWRVSPASVLVVGDRPDWDVGGALAAGMQSALTTEYVDHRDLISSTLTPTFIISGLAELLHIIR